MAAHGGLATGLEAARLRAGLAIVQMGFVGLAIRAGQLAVHVGVQEGVGFRAAHGHAAPPSCFLRK